VRRSAAGSCTFERKISTRGHAVSRGGEIPFIVHHGPREEKKKRMNQHDVANFYKVTFITVEREGRKGCGSQIIVGG